MNLLNVPNSSSLLVLGGGFSLKNTQSSLKSTSICFILAVNVSFVVSALAAKSLMASPKLKGFFNVKE